jgi:hypothetical protein
MDRDESPRSRLRGITATNNVKKQILKTALLLLISFLGFTAGRIGHIYGGQLNVPHHWIYGVLAIILGIVLTILKKEAGPYLITFGVGLTLSDTIDMFELRILGPDTVSKVVFWGID